MSAACEPVAKQCRGIIQAVSYDGRNEAAPHQVQQTKQKAKQGSCNYTLKALNVVAQAEGNTPDQQSNTGTAEVVSETIENEGTLQFLLDPSGDECRKKKQAEIMRRPDYLGQRVLLDIIFRPP